jgi:hypothetical protein
VVLNIPSNETYTLKGSDETHCEMNIRYGGPSSAVDDNDDDETGSGEIIAVRPSQNLIGYIA